MLGENTKKPCALISTSGRISNTRGGWPNALSFQMISQPDKDRGNTIDTEMKTTKLDESTNQDAECSISG